MPISVTTGAKSILRSVVWSRRESMFDRGTGLWGRAVGAGCGSEASGVGAAPITLVCVHALTSDPMDAHNVHDVLDHRYSWRTVGEARPNPVGSSVVFLHGLMGSRWSWEPQLASIGSSRHALAWDAPSFGGSAQLPSPPSFDALADAVIEFADTAGLAKFHLVGLSFGGMVAQHTALRHADRLVSLSLLSTSPKFGFDGVTMPDTWRAARLARLDAGEQPQDFAPAVLNAISGPHISQDALAEQIHAASFVPAAALRMAVDVLVTHDTRDVLANIKTPTLCAVGALDDETPVDYVRFIADQIPDAHFEIVPNAGHLLNAEAPELVNELLAQHFEASEHLEAHE